MGKTMYIGSARSDEKKKYSGGKPGDQRQTSKPDYTGEVSMQTFYVHNKGWIVMRAKSVNIANRLADAMAMACNNSNIGYSQTTDASGRLGILKYGTQTTVACNCDCSSLVRECLIEASGIDAGNFNTGNERSCLIGTGLFMNPIEYTPNVPIFNGDILITKTKGHTAIVVWGNPRNASSSSAQYYPKYTGKSDSFSDALAEMGIDKSKEFRTKIAQANGISNYTFSSAQNILLFEKLKTGNLKKP